MKAQLFLKVLLFLLLPSLSFSQASLVKKASKNNSDGNVKLALMQISTATDLSINKKGKYLKSPDTWMVKGDICQSVFTKDKSLLEDPLGLALESYQKAYYCDKGNKQLNPIQIKLVQLIKNYIDQAKSQFNEGQFANSLDSFEQVLKIESLDYMKNPLSEDSIIIYNAGLAAFKAQNWTKAVTYFDKSAKLGYNGVKSYQLLSETYRQINDMNGYNKTVEECIRRYPDSRSLFGR